jgi:fluoroquinolone resistance protein
MDFTNNIYYQKKFQKFSLTKETLKEKEFEECQFSECSFIDGKFEKCKFINCKFNSCLISAVSPIASRFVEVSFLESKVIGLDWTKADSLQEISFTNCQINYSNFRLLKLPKIKMIACEAKEVDFAGADISEGVFTDTDFERSIFSKTNLTKADFRGAKNYFIDARYNSIKKAHFSLPEVLSLLNGLDIIID